MWLLWKTKETSRSTNIGFKWTEGHDETNSPFCVEPCELDQENTHKLVQIWCLKLFL